MSTEREQAEALARVIHEAECVAYEHEGRNARCEREARAILGSDWLPEVKAAARAEHGERIAQALEQLEEYSKDLTWETGEVLIPREAAADVARSTP